MFPWLQKQILHEWYFEGQKTQICITKYKIIYIAY